MIKTKFKVGDKIKIKKNIKMSGYESLYDEGCLDTCCMSNKEIERNKKKEFTIFEINNDSDGDMCYGFTECMCDDCSATGAHRKPHWMTRNVDFDFKLAKAFIAPIKTRIKEKRPIKRLNKEDFLSNLEEM